MFTSLLVVFLLRQWFLTRKARATQSDLELHPDLSLRNSSAL